MVANCPDFWTVQILFKFYLRAYKYSAVLRSFCDRAAELFNSRWLLIYAFIQLVW